MLPRLDPQELVSPLYQQFANQLSKQRFSGDVSMNYGARLAVATDNSVYQQLPQLVLHPRSQQDVQLITSLANETQFNEIKFSARGGGTGTNGQSLTPGIVVDLSKYMNRIIEINVEENWVKVEAGVVKDQLNDYLRPHGFFFSPDLSTSNRATLGGMINTDASGQGSLVYGKTSNHVIELKSVLANGDLIHSKAMPIADAKKLAEQESSYGKLVKQVLASCLDNRQLILDKFPRLNRFLTGYDLEHVFNDDLTEFNLSRLITGSEGSLAIVCEAKLNLTPIAKAKTLINIKYDSFDSALRHSPHLVSAKATSVETIDSKVLNLARKDIIWHSVSDLITNVDGKTMDGINIVEYNGDSVEALAVQVEQLTAQLEVEIAEQQNGVIGYQVTSDLDSIGKLYAMRKKAVGLLGAAEGNKKPLAFAEDTAVPPENLADYILEFRRLLDSYHLDYGMFGHVDAGVLHVRPALDMCDIGQEKILRKISDRVVQLTAKYGGLMWGEHGKGYRSEYSPAFFGDELFTELRKIKTVFDPLNKMNPGKICTPLCLNEEGEDIQTEQLVSVDDKKRGFYDRQIPVKVKESFTAALDCNGNGLCFNYDVDSPMCPSSKVTRDRRHSPKGRAGLMREWLRLLQQRGVDILSLEQKVSHWSVKRLLDKVKNNLSAANSNDFSHEVMDAMSGCLACKACASQCPIKVDVPDFRARFMNIYYSRYNRPLKDHLVAHVETLAPAMALMPKITNAVLSTGLYKSFSKKVIGYVDTPLLSVPTLKQQTEQQGFDSFDLSKLEALSEQEKQQHILIIQDPFTSFYDAKSVTSLMGLAKKLGFNPILVPFKPNGKAQHVKGFLAKFAKTAQSSADFLNKLHLLGIPMVGTDASLVLCYRDEYKQILADKRGDFTVLLAHEWLTDNLTTIDIKADNKESNTNNNVDFQLFSHCTEKTALVKSEDQWVTIFKHFGLSLNKVAVGCCGMAGTYGHEAVNYDNSKQLFEMSWQSKLDKLKPEQVLATGFSCRSQTKRFAGLQARHPVEALLVALNNT